MRNVNKIAATLGIVLTAGMIVRTPMSTVNAEEADQNNGGGNLQGTSNETNGNETIDSIDDAELSYLAVKEREEQAYQNVQMASKEQAAAETLSIEADQKKVEAEETLQEAKASLDQELEAEKAEKAERKAELEAAAKAADEAVNAAQNNVESATEAAEKAATEEQVASGNYENLSATLNVTAQDVEDAQSVLSSATEQQSEAQTAFDRAKEDEEKAVAALAEAQNAVNAADADVAEKSAALSQAKEKVIQAEQVKSQTAKELADLEALLANDDELKQLQEYKDNEAAKQALADAEAALETAEQELVAAQTALAKRESELTAAESAHTLATQQLVAAQTEQNEAAAAKNEAEAALNQSKQLEQQASVAEDAASATLAQKQSDLTSAQAAETQAQNENDSAKQAAVEAGENVTAKTAAVQKAENGLDAATQFMYKKQNSLEVAETEKNDAATALATSASALETAEQAVTAAQDEKNAADLEVEAKETQVQTAASELEAANNALSKAQAAKTAADNTLQEKLDAFEAQAVAYTKDSYGYFAYKNSTDALNILNGIDETWKRYGYDSASKPDGFDESTESVKGQAGSSTSLENMRLALQWILECNLVREADEHNLPVLQVTDELMAMAQKCANYSDDASRGHSSYFQAAENLAWGYDAAYTNTDEADGPFNGWYTKEKALYQEALAEHPAYESMSAYELSQADSTFYHKVGHYLNIIDTKTLTGYAISTLGNNSYGRNHETHAQEFATPSYGYENYGTAVTIESYIEDFNEFYQWAQKAGDGELKLAPRDVMRAYYNAISAADTATQELATAQATANEKKQAKDEADQALVDAQTVQSEKATALNNANDSKMVAQADKEAKTSANEAALNAYNTAKSAYNAATDDVTAKNSALATAKENLETAETAKQAADETETASAQALATAQGVTASAQTAVTEAENVLATAQAVHTAAQDDTAEKQSAFDAASTTLTTAQAKVADKQTAVDTAKTILDTAKENKASAQTVLNTKAENRASARTAEEAAETNAVQKQNAFDLVCGDGHVADLRQADNEAAEKLAAAKTTENNAQTALTEAQNSQTQANSLKTAKETDLNEKKATTADKESALTIATAATVAAQKTYDETSADYNSLTESAAALQAAKEKLAQAQLAKEEAVKNLTKMQDQWKQIEAQLEEAQAEQEKLQSVTAQQLLAGEAMEEIQSKYSELVSKVTASEEAVSVAKTNAENYKAAYEQKKETAAKASKDYSYAQADLAIAKQECVEQLEIIRGEALIFDQDADQEVTGAVFASSGNYIQDGKVMFQGIEIDGVLVDPQYYTVRQGSTYVTLSREYMDSLPEGNHVLTFLYEYGEIETNFTVIDTSSPADDEKAGDDVAKSETAVSQESIEAGVRSPKTGENTNRFLLFAELFAGISAVGYTVSGRKKQNR